MEIDKKYVVISECKCYNWLNPGLHIEYSMLFVGLLPFVEMYFKYEDYVTKFRTPHFMFACLV